MKARITITNAQGITFEGEVELSKAGRSLHKIRKKNELKKATPTSLEFGMPIRAFIKKNSRGMSGAKKFTLLLAYLTKGAVDSEIELSEIETHWNKMTSLLNGKFNRAHSIRAKENGWVDSSKQGVYVLRPDWNEIFKA